MQEEMREMLGEFIAESRELLESAQAQMVHLEDNEDPELVNGIFRALHTVKGSSGFLELTAVTRVSHAAEDLLNAIRHGQRQADPQAIDLLLQATDRLLGYLAELENGTEDLQVDDTLVAELRQVLGEPAAGPLAHAAAVPGTAKPADPAPAAPAAATPEGLSPELVDMIDPFLADSRAAIEVLQTSLRAPTLVRADLEPILEQFTASLEFFHTTDVLESLRAFSAAIRQEPPDRQAAAGALAQMQQRVDRVERLVRGDSAAPAPAAAPVQGRKAPARAPAKGATGEALVEQTLRVGVVRLDELLNLVGELVLEKNHIAAMAEGKRYDAMPEAANQLNLITSELQMAVMKVRMQPVERLFGKYPRLVRDVARQCGKDVELTIVGAETELDKSVIERLGDPLVHLLRNAVDHGVESPADRRACGKSETGHVTLRAQYQGNHAVVTVQDDGGGIDANRVREKAVERGLVSAEHAGDMSRRELLNLIFEPGFSLARQVSDISGRGVGMDVVRSNVEQLGGTVDIDSERGQGTAIHIRIPLTLAIVQALLTATGERKLAVPLANVAEIVRCDAKRVQSLNGRAVFTLRDRTLPILRLRDGGAKPVRRRDELDGGYLLVLTTAEMEFALAVDRLMRQEEVVIKPLGTMFRHIKEVSGAAILGDGSVSLIVDVPALAAAARRAGKAA